ncbi:putative E3 ubiquitin-protein ligase RF298 [Cynara cardunculus var. scolymus]|uniref:Zinc finger, RING/FYVE/PHD-type n=1 Tax=Cynara cardunculus var. scolymus TaxID=59895 RepID=A0A118K7L7_CYNCS|nr:putative E3 ubiquitin-protein ligase RF298 [Cynara cardunculus var. scolymus]KVI12435.1 Zinc finger, RING/FYVE/PHD-type [Cynara cardunculus var. scolymus]
MAEMKAKLNWPEEEDGELDSDYDWDCSSVSGLRKLMTDGLHSCFGNAVKKIVENGYPEQVAEFVVLKSGPFFGSKDMVSVIVDRALNSLRTKGCHDSKFYIFEELHTLVEFMILEMVTMLREVKPFLSVREALWTLLICDLNVIHASEAELDPMKFFIDSVKAAHEIETSSDSESQNQEILASNVEKQDMVVKSLKSSPKSSKSGKRIEDKCPSCRKWCSGNSHKKDAVREKMFRFEKPYKGRMSKKALKEKLAAWGDLVSDKKHPSCESSSGTKKTPTLALKETEETAKATPKPEPVAPVAAPEPTKTVQHYLASIPYDESKGEHVPRDVKDKILLAAVDQVLALHKELRDWDDWANLKVMQVAKRLSQDRAELNKLRAEKEEAEKMMKDKQVAEENNMRKLSEMTTALNNANYQIEMASSAVVRLKSEKIILKKEMEAARIRSSIEAKRLEAALQKEQEAYKKSQSFGTEKSLLEEELKALKHEVVPIQRSAEKAKDLLSQTQIRLANEEKETAKVVLKYESLKRERELIEEMAKSEEEMVVEKAEKKLQKFENEMKRIQYEISAMKLEQETKKIAAMRTGMNWPVFEGSKSSEILRNNNKNGNLRQKKDRECVMCLTEEMTVVLVPCGHQVLCADCNVIHEQNGMKDCPSCRTPIQKRINARFAKS